MFHCHYNTTVYRLGITKYECINNIKKIYISNDSSIKVSGTLHSESCLKNSTQPATPFTRLTEPQLRVYGQNVIILEQPIKVKTRNKCAFTL